MLTPEMSACLPGCNGEILEPFVGTGRGFLAPRANVQAPTDFFDMMMRRTPGFDAAMLLAGFRTPQGNPMYAIKKLVNLFGDFADQL